MDTQSLYPSPRSIAASILAEPDVARQRTIFLQCPEHLRALVREHVKSARALSAPRNRQPSPTAIKPSAPPRHYKPIPRLADLKRSAPEVAREHLQSLRHALTQSRAHA